MFFCLLEVIKLFTMSRGLFRLNKKFLLHVAMNTRLFLEDLLQCKRITSLFTVPHFSLKILTVNYRFGSHDVHLKCNFILLRILI